MVLFKQGLTIDIFVGFISTGDEEVEEDKRLILDMFIFADI